MDPNAIPWQASLGVAGAAVMALITFGVWFIRQLVTGKLLTGGQHEARVADALRQQEQILASEKRRGDEWKETAKLEQKGRIEATEIAKNAVEGLRVSDYFFSTQVPKLPRTGDNGAEEVSP